MRFKLPIICPEFSSEDWSPEQISAWLNEECSKSRGLCVPHETIYRSLYKQTRGLFRKEIRSQLRTKIKFRHTKNHKAAPRGQIVKAVSLRDRPSHIEDRFIPGHCEGDLFLGANNRFIATVVERQSRFTMLVKVAGQDTNSVVSALYAQMIKLPAHLKQSLTRDRVTELARHKKFSVATDIDVYFCDPSSP
jgi:IS30 family transposase